MNMLHDNPIASIFHNFFHNHIVSRQFSHGHVQYGGKSTKYVF